MFEMYASFFTIEREQKKVNLFFYNQTLIGRQMSDQIRLAF